MVEDSLESDRRIGMVVVLPDHVHEMAGDPQVYPIGTLGSFDRCSARADGTFDITLNGISRFRILREIPREAGRLYRSVEFESLEDHLSSDPESIRELRAEVSSLSQELLRRLAPKKLEIFTSDTIRDLDDEMFVNLLSLAFDFLSNEVQTLVDSASIAQRYEGLRSLLRFRLADPSGRGSSDPGWIQ